MTASSMSDGDDKNRTTGERCRAGVAVRRWFPVSLTRQLVFAVQLDGNRCGLLHVDGRRCERDNEASRSLVLTICDPGNGDRSTTYENEAIEMPEALELEIAKARRLAFASRLQDAVLGRLDCRPNPELVIYAECDLMKQGHAATNCDGLIASLTEYGEDLHLADKRDIDELKAIRSDFEALCGVMACSAA